MQPMPAEIIVQLFPKPLLCSIRNDRWYVEQAITLQWNVQGLRLSLRQQQAMAVVTQQLIVFPPQLLLAVAPGVMRSLNDGMQPMPAEITVQPFLKPLLPGICNHL